jgi:hypothetical protein
MEEAFVVCFKALYQHSPEGTGKNYKETWQEDHIPVPL